jgi:hypothetical protein
VHDLAGRTNLTEWYLPTKKGHEELVAFGRKPSEFNPTAFQGIHARHVLILFDESCGIPRSLWDAADSLISNEESRFLAVGNPDDPDSEFAEVCKPGSGWNVIGIDAFETPNFTAEPIPPDLKHLLISPTWVDEKRRKWGEANPLWMSKVRGQFPEISKDSLIPPAWIRRAQEADLQPGEPIELGVDVGGGGDLTVFALRRGPVVQIIGTNHDPDTMRNCGEVIRHLEETGAAVAKIDMNGIGRGMVNRLEEQGIPVVGINVGEGATDRAAFKNLRAELYWSLRERFEAQEIALDPNDHDLAAELVSLQYKPTSTGQVQIVSKKEMGSSPDRADAVMLAFAPRNDGPLIA